VSVLLNAFKGRRGTGLDWAVGYETPKTLNSGQVEELSLRFIVAHIEQTGKTRRSKFGTGRSG
jgi:hypothetical protein